MDDEQFRQAMAAHAEREAELQAALQAAGTMDTRFAAGVTWLDECSPGWWERVDLDKLDGRRDPGELLDQLGLHLDDLDLADRGFEPHSWEDEYDELTERWVQLVCERRDQW